MSNDNDQSSGLNQRATPQTEVRGDGMPSSDASQAWFTFDGAGFTPAVSPIPESDEVDFDKALKDAGFALSGRIGGEFSVCEVFIYRGDSRKIWLVSVMVSGTGLVDVLCSNGVLVLKFLGEYCAPLLKLNLNDVTEMFFERAHDVLFDPERGLECAQRVGDHEARIRFEAKRSLEQRRKSEEK